MLNILMLKYYFQNSFPELRHATDIQKAVRLAFRPVPVGQIMKMLFGGRRSAVGCLFTEE
jgi:hypothetical protein